jgi:hypothetical protein
LVVVAIAAFTAFITPVFFVAQLCACYTITFFIVIITCASDTNGQSSFATRSNCGPGRFYVETGA